MEAKQCWRCWTRMINLGGSCICKQESNMIERNSNRKVDVMDVKDRPDLGVYFRNVYCKNDNDELVVHGEFCCNGEKCLVKEFDKYVTDSGEVYKFHNKDELFSQDSSGHGRNGRQDTMQFRQKENRSDVDMYITEGYGINMDDKKEDIADLYAGGEQQSVSELCERGSDTQRSDVDIGVREESNVFQEDSGWTFQVDTGYTEGAISRSQKVWPMKDANRGVQMDTQPECTVSRLPARVKGSRIRPKGAYCVVGGCEVRIQYDTYTYKRHLRGRHKNLSVKQCNDAVDEFRQRFYWLKNGSGIGDCCANGEQQLAEEICAHGGDGNKISDQHRRCTDSVQCAGERACGDPEQAWNERDRGGVVKVDTQPEDMISILPASVVISRIRPKGGYCVVGSCEMPIQYDIYTYKRHLGRKHKNLSVKQYSDAVEEFRQRFSWLKNKKEGGVRRGTMHGLKDKKGIRKQAKTAYCAVESCGQRFKYYDISQYKDHLKTQRHRGLSRQQYNDCLEKVKETVSRVSWGKKGKSVTKTKTAYCVIENCGKRFRYYNSISQYKCHLRTQRHKDLSEEQFDEYVKRFKEIISQVSWDIEEQGVRKNKNADCVVESCGDSSKYDNISDYNRQLKTEMHKDLSREESNDCVKKCRESTSLLSASESDLRHELKGALCVVGTCGMWMRYNILSYKQHLRQRHESLSKEAFDDAVQQFGQMWLKVFRHGFRGEMKDCEEGSESCWQPAHVQSNSFYTVGSMCKETLCTVDNSDKHVSDSGQVWKVQERDELCNQDSSGADTSGRQENVQSREMDNSCNVPIYVTGKCGKNMDAGEKMDVKYGHIAEFCANREQQLVEGICAHGTHSETTGEGGDIGFREEKNILQQYSRCRDAGQCPSRKTCEEPEQGWKAKDSGGVVEVNIEAENIMQCREIDNICDLPMYFTDKYRKTMDAKYECIDEFCGNGEQQSVEEVCGQGTQSRTTGGAGYIEVRHKSKICERYSRCTETDPCPSKKECKDSEEATNSKYTGGLVQGNTLPEGTVSLLAASVKHTRMQPKGPYCVLGTCEVDMRYYISIYKKHLKEEHKNLSVKQYVDAVYKFCQKYCSVKKKRGVRSEANGGNCVVESCAMYIQYDDIYCKHYLNPQMQRENSEKRAGSSGQVYRFCMEDEMGNQDSSDGDSNGRGERLEFRGIKNGCDVPICDTDKCGENMDTVKNMDEKYRSISLFCGNGEERSVDIFAGRTHSRTRGEVEDIQVTNKNKTCEQYSKCMESERCSTEKACKDSEKHWNLKDTGGVVQLNTQAEESASLWPDTWQPRRIRAKGAYCVVATCEMRMNYDIFNYKRHLTRAHRDLSVEVFNDAVDKFRNKFSRLQREQGCRMKPYIGLCVVKGCGKWIRYYDISQYKAHLKTGKHKDLSIRQFNDYVKKFKEAVHVGT